jgi:hypothetical protein
MTSSSSDCQCHYYRAAVFRQQKEFLCIHLSSKVGCSVKIWQCAGVHDEVNSEWRQATHGPEATPKHRKWPTTEGFVGSTRSVHTHSYKVNVPGQCRDKGIIETVRVSCQGDSQTCPLGCVMTNLGKTSVDGGLRATESDSETPVRIQLPKPARHLFRIQLGGILGCVAKGAREIAGISQRNRNLSRRGRPQRGRYAGLVDKNVQAFRSVK